MEQSSSIINIFKDCDALLEYKIFELGHFVGAISLSKGGGTLQQVVINQSIIIKIFTIKENHIELVFGEKPLLHTERQILRHPDTFI